MTNEHLLSIQHLNVSFWTEKDYLQALNDVSFHIQEGEILGVVGESGCGKSVTADTILRLHDEQLTDYDGKIMYGNKNLLELSEKKLRTIRGNKISMIFQDPMSSLNPVFTIGDQIVESLKIHQKISRKNAHQKAVELLRIVGIKDPEIRVNEYPHQLSGGMRQRVMIAMAICCEPELLIADEPTTALDVTIQAQIIQVIRQLRLKNKMSVLFITHDLGVVAQACDRVVIMYLGQVIEVGLVKEIFNSPRHPYTKGLIKAMPQPTSDRNQPLYEIKGTVPSLTNIPDGCRFANRCAFATDKCRNHVPSLVEDETGHSVRCFYAEYLREGFASDKQYNIT